MAKNYIKRLALPIGMEFFDALRDEGAYYVDKTDFIRNLVETKANVTLITRPRRFGKTLTMTMLRSFFDIRRDSKKYFEGLAISKHPELCAQWMNQYPTIFLTLKGVEGGSFGDAYLALKNIISDVCGQHLYLRESNLVEKKDLEVFLRLYDKGIEREYYKGVSDAEKREAMQSELTVSLNLLSKMLAAHWGKPVMILMDEYDVPLAKASAYGYYDEMVRVIRSLMNNALKTNDNLKRAFLTGCLRVSRESIFTGLNNLRVDTISDDELSEFIGFTQAEVDQILKGGDLTQCGDALKEWYDGYIFGTSEMYCPWDVMNHVDKLLFNPQTPPQSYWKNSSSNDVLMQFFEKGLSSGAQQRFETLLAGGSIQVEVAEELTYGTLTDNEDNFWSLLYLTGYLTKADKTPTNGKNLELRIPNAEIKDLFQDTIIERFRKIVRSPALKSLFEAFWAGDATTAQEEVEQLLCTTISYYDNKEDFYHAFIAGMFAGMGYIVQSNRESGEGRPDVLVMDNPRRTALVIEIKHSASGETLEADCVKALEQIREKKYTQAVDSTYKTIHCYGIAFYKKTCQIKKLGTTEGGRKSEPKDVQMG